MDFVQRAPLFRGLARPECEGLSRLARDQRVVRRECFYLQGDPADDVMLLCAGSLKMTQLGVDGDRMLLHFTGPGDAFGALDVAAGATYPTDAEALEPSHALLWDRTTIDDIAERHPVLLRNVIRIVTERMRSLEERCSQLSSRRMPQRVASTLLRLLPQIGRAAEGGVLIGLTREELADMAGTTLFSVSRILGEWESLGLVRPRREGVVVVDAPRLAGVARENGGLRAAGGRS